MCFSRFAKFAGCICFAKNSNLATDNTDSADFVADKQEDRGTLLAHEEYVIRLLTHIGRASLSGIYFCLVPENVSKFIDSHG